LNPENSYIFAIAMHGYTFILKYLLLLGCFISLSSFSQTVGKDSVLVAVSDTIAKSDTIIHKNSQQVDDLISYAKKFLGTPYRYGGMTPSGFDCSGFINYIFGNFGFELTRTSYGLAEFGQTVKLADIQPGDLMFFKGSNVHSTQVGHVAMVVEVSPGAIKFIHSASGGVAINTFNTSKYYIPRFIKAKRLDYGVRE
jgi:cell wall-associated NlpC family hydrolase